MKYCEYCGAPLDDDALFCTKCGARLNPVQPAPLQEANTQPRKAAKSTILFIVLVLALVAGIVIAILTLGKKAKETNRDIDETEEVVQQKKVRLHGAVDTYPVYMKLTIEGNMVNGSYYYESQGPHKVLTLKGIYEDSKLELFETNEDGQQTGHFTGQLKKGIFIGDFYNVQGKSMHFRLQE